MSEDQIVDSSFTAIINAPIDKVDILARCFSLPEHEYQDCSSPQDLQLRQTTSECASMSNLPLSSATRHGSKKTRRCAAMINGKYRLAALRRRS
jgi:hypothetical protein